MAYNAMDYQRMVEEYVNSPAGRKFLKTQKNINVGYTEAEALIIAENLNRDIVSAYLDIVRDPHANVLFNENLIYVKSYFLKNQLRMRILFHSYVLSRPSLYAKDKPVGTGLYDIIGFFTQGNPGSKQVYGYWEALEGEYDNGWVKGRTYLAPNPFINNIINSYKTRYPDVIFQWPVEWGGNN